MPPRKRKATAVSELPSVNDAVQAVHVDPKALEAIQQRLKLIDAAGRQPAAASSSPDQPTLDTQWCTIH